MTDEERRLALSDKLHRKGFIVAADELMKMHLEIERLAEELRISKKEIERLKNELQVWTGIRA